MILFTEKKEMKTIVIGVIGADVHAVGNKIIDYVINDNSIILCVCSILAFCW